MGCEMALIVEINVMVAYLSDSPGDLSTLWITRS